MSAKTLALAAALLLGAVYLKCTMPIFAQEGIPALQHMLTQEQVEIYVPETWMAWLDWS
jgi:hypothetical protein